MKTPPFIVGTLTLFTTAFVIIFSIQVYLVFKIVDRIDTLTQTSLAGDSTAIKMLIP